MSFEPDLPVTVFYLATEPFRGGFRWLVRRYGTTDAIEIGNEPFATEAEARKSGRKALIRSSAHGAGRRRDGASFGAPVGSGAPADPHSAWD